MAYNNMIARTDTVMREEWSNEIISAVPQASAVLSLMRRLPNMSAGTRKLPVMSALPVAGFVDGDNGLKPTSKAAWSGKIITAEEIAVIIPIPDAVRDDLSYDIWAEIKPSIIEAFVRVIDAAAIFGTDKPTSWPAGIVTAATSAGKTVALGTGVDVAADINALMSAVEASGYEVSGFAGDVQMKGRLRGLRDLNNAPIYVPALAGAVPGTIYGLPMMAVKNGAWDSTAAHLIAGDWSQAVYAIRQDITYKILEEAVITDGDGAIVYNLAQQDMTALRVTMRLGWQLPNPVNAIDGTNNRYPFAVLTPAEEPDDEEEEGGGAGGDGENVGG